MRKILNKFLAVFVSFVMAITMIPLSGIVSHAENDGVEVGDSSNVTSVYERVSDPSKLGDGDEVIIASGTNALKADKNGNIGKDTITLNNNVASPKEGTVWKVSGSNGSYTFANDNVSGSNNKLNLNSNRISIGSGDTLSVNSNGQISTKKYGTTYYMYYDAYYRDEFTTTDWGQYHATQFTFYKMVNRAQLTINYIYDGKTESVTKDVALGETVDITNDFPEKEEQSYNFEKMVYNSTDYNVTNVKVKGNAVIDVYYQTASDTVKFNVNFYVNGIKQSDSYKKSVKKGTKNVSIPSKYSQYNFSKMTVNDGDEQTTITTKFDVNSDTTVKYYYLNPGGPDSYLPDGDLNGPDEPDYPNQGAVRLNKTADSSIFSSTGLTRVELGVTGVPVKKGIDVVIVLDESGSMAWDVNGEETRTQSKRRIYIAKEAARNFARKILAANEDGTKSNNRVSVVSFNTYSNKRCDLKNSDNLESVISAINAIGGSNNNPSGGTNYDAGVEQAKNILESAKNADGYNRSQAVLFMSDGAPTNGYNGTYDFNNNISYSRFGNAMKAHTYSTDVKNLGATMYTVGFGLADSNYFTKAQCETVLRDWMASGTECFKSVTTANELNDAFQNIAAAIKKAGTGATLTDKIGPAFELQMAAPSQASEFDTSIKVSSYDLDEKGNKTGTPETIEVVTFSKDGKTAKSSLKGDTNILDADGNIDAAKFTYDAETRTFSWRIGDITQKEIVLSFVEYLTDSMSTTGVPKGDYPTNDGDASLEYTNYKGNSITKTKESPELPWGSASITVEYYLVNENGQPVNYDGTVIKEGFKKVIDEKKVSININQDTTIKANDPNYLPSGYELLNKDAYYTVNHPGQPSAEQLSSHNDVQDKGSTLVSGKKPYTTSTVSFGVLAKSDLKEDTVVLDYGKPVTIDVRANDGFKSATLNGVSKTFDSTKVALNTGVKNESIGGFINSIDGSYGTLAVKESAKGTVKYTPTKYMDGIDKYYYEVKGSVDVMDEESKTTETVDAFKYSSVSIIPATSVYYEDNFSSGTTNEDKTTNGIVYNGKAWTEATNGTTVGKEEQDAEQGKNTTYGQDSSYANDTTFSYGSAHVVTAEKGAPASAKFTFKGTGFEIIGRTDNNTGMMTVKVYDLKTNTLVKNIPCNTVYEEKDGVLYQIPVISVDGLSYGQYKVIITVTGTTDQDGINHSSTVYIDGVRIFNPIDPNGTDADATEANNKYKEDNEANQVVYEIRNLLLDKNSLTGGTDANGVVYVDSEGNITDPTRYKDLGPNNEVYLKKGNSIGFKLRSSQPAAIKIGLKTPDGKAGEVTVGSSKDSSGDPIVLNTATSMYYDVTNKIVFDDNNEAYVVITNTGNNDAIVSLTKIKFTFESKPAISPQLVVNQNDAKYISNMTLSRNGVEVDDNNKDNTSNDKPNSDTTDKPNNDTTNNNTSVINKVVNFFKNLFKK